MLKIYVLIIKMNKKEVNKNKKKCFLKNKFNFRFNSVN